MSSPHKKFTEVQGIKLSYLEWGDAGNPALLLVHGWTSFAASWTAVAECFRDRYHIIAPDLRGHGESDKPATGYRLSDFAEDIRQLVGDLNLRKPIYAGHSWGGAIGTILASDSSAIISRALLEDPVYWRMIHAFMTALPGALARNNKPEAEIRAEAKQKHLSLAEKDLEVYRHRGFSAQALIQLMTDNRDWALDFERYFKGIAVPTKILVADHKVGGAIMREELSYLERIAPPQVEFEFWENVPHGMKAAKPMEYNRTLEAWIAT